MIELEEDIYGQRALYCEGTPALLFTENETNHARLGGAVNGSIYVKDGINDYRCARSSDTPSTPADLAQRHRRITT